MNVIIHSYSQQLSENTEKINVQKKAKNFVWSIIRTKYFDVIRPKICHLPVFQLEGKIAGSNIDFSAIVAANKQLCHYFSKISYADVVYPNYFGKFCYYKLPYFVKEMKCDVVFVESEPAFSSFLLSQDFFIMPYVNFSLNISTSLDSIIKNMHKSKRRIIRRIERLGLTYEITRDYEKLKLFYYKMYLSRVLSSHGKAAEPISFAECKRLFQEGGLILVKLAGKTIGGAVYVSKGDELYLPISGMSSYIDNLRNISHTAIIYFLILFGKKNGYKKIDDGFCLPFLNDGVLQYKKSFGMRITDKSNTRILGIKFCNFKESARYFILKNPFIFVYNKNFCGLVMFNPEEDLYKTYYLPGLSRMLIICSSQDAHLLRHRYKSISKLNSSQVPPINSLLKQVSVTGYELYELKF
ncbi:MAG: hypothetical protein QXE05_09890 [Nitrososphaeria archaeon]